MSAPKKELKKVFVDVETTSLRASTGEIIEFCIGTEKGRVWKICTRKVTPEFLDRADPISLEINGYTDKNWKMAVSQKVAAGLIVSCLTDADVWIGHNPDFDRRFIRALLKEYYPGFTLPKLVVDTRSLAVAALAADGLTSSGMDIIRKHLGWSLANAHTAEKDVLDCRRLFNLCKPYQF